MSCPAGVPIAVQCRALPMFKSSESHIQSTTSDDIKCILDHSRAHPVKNGADTRLRICLRVAQALLAQVQQKATASSLTSPFFQCLHPQSFQQKETRNKKDTNIVLNDKTIRVLHQLASPDVIVPHNVSSLAQQDSLLNEIPWRNRLAEAINRLKSILC